jgi:hypothetical protein
MTDLDSFLTPPDAVVGLELMALSLTHCDLQTSFGLALVAEAHLVLLDLNLN